MKNNNSIKTVVAVGIGAALFFVLGRFVAIPSPVPSSSPSSGVCRTCVIQRRKTGCSASGAIAPDKTSMP